MSKKGESQQIKLERNIGFGFGWLVGCFSSWIVYGVYSSWGMFSGAKWWEVMTAIGTIGAAVGALWISYNNQENYKREKVLNKLYYLDGVVLPTLKTIQSNLIKQDILNVRDTNRLEYVHNEIARLDTLNAQSFLRDEVGLIKKINHLRSLMEELANYISKRNLSSSHHCLLESKNAVVPAITEATDIFNNLTRRLPSHS